MSGLVQTLPVNLNLVEVWYIGVDRRFNALYGRGFQRCCAHFEDCTVL